ncbi:MAG: metallophosphoesterase [Verrucomicrobia bacterium]|nr:metallophosphoesterase [Verrucomicrobiota bacterium]
MRLLFVADLHYSLKQFDWLLAEAEGYDLVAIGGDLLDLASPLDPDVQIAIVEKYLGLLRQKTTLVVSSGNHDGDSRNEADESVAEWVREAALAPGVGGRIHTDGEGFDFGDARITVCPWWDGDSTRAAIDRLLEKEASLRRDRWIWIHHAPPEGSRTSWSGKRFIGDGHLSSWIGRYQPEMVFSGHIHNSPFYPEGSWIDRIGRTWVFNPGKQPGPEPTAIVVDLEAMTAEWRSFEGSSLRELRVA